MEGKLILSEKWEEEPTAWKESSYKWKEEGHKVIKMAHTCAKSGIPRDAKDRWNKSG